MQTIDETRRARLKMLEAEFGTQSALADRLGKSPPQLNQWLRGAPDSKTGKPRAISTEAAREIEELTAKPRGWMDQPVAPQSVDGVLSHKAEQLAAGEPTITALIERVGALLAQADGTTRDAVLKLLTRYAEAPEDGERIAAAIELLLKPRGK